VRVFFTNLGCKLNQAELERLARRFDAAGHRVVGRLEDAELHVVNTCTVTHLAARTSRKTARRGARQVPGLRTVLTGCYVAEAPEEAARLAGVDLVVDNADKEHLLERVHEAFPEWAPAVPPESARPAAAGPAAALPIDVPYVPLAFGNTRALVKVEDGCNMRCAFCIIPFTRGAQRSRPVDEVVTEVRSMALAGVREVVVTGVQISHYRHGDARLYDLTRALLDGTADLPAPPRLRLTSIAPWMFDERLFELWQEGSDDGAGNGSGGGRRLCRHVHMSLQSGCDATLARMRRPYTSAAYLDLVQRIRAAVPGVAITTDVIVGFPGETDDEFAASLAFVEAVGFAKVHAFPYSQREGTAAARMPQQVPHGVKRQRMTALLAAADAAEHRFRAEHVGTVAEVLWEEHRDGCWLGTSDNYLRVVAAKEHAAAADLLRTLTAARLTGLVDGGAVDAALAGVPLPLD
jgi:threonylcarbamoyladenosine tRNA methylthiotransferase MtaB